MIAVDASVVIEVLLATSTASRVAARLFAEGQTLHAPHLFDVEIAQLAFVPGCMLPLSQAETEPPAMCLLAWDRKRYCPGLGVRTSKQEGTEWLRKAMDHACLNNCRAEKRSVDPICLLV